MENGKLENGKKQWRFNTCQKEAMSGDNRLTVRAAVNMLRGQLNPNDHRPVVSFGSGDPSAFDCFRPAAPAEDAVVEAIRSGHFNGYAHSQGLPTAKKAVATHISRDLPYRLSQHDVVLTVGCKQAINATISALVNANPDSNILLPMPAFSMYDASAAFARLEVRHYDLLPENGWEVDLASVEAQADEKTVALVIINPGNPCGSVYSRKHLEKVAETAGRLGLLVIADEIYEHITFGRNPFVRMGVFASKVPVLTLGAISKRWMVPGWRLGWLVTTDPNGILQKSKFTILVERDRVMRMQSSYSNLMSSAYCSLMPRCEKLTLQFSSCQLLERIKAFLDIASDPSTFIQAAIPKIIEKTEEEFFSNTIDILRQNANTIIKSFEEIPSISCPSKPEGSMFVVVKLNVSLLDGIKDDTDFCLKLAEEENVIVIPGSTLGMTNWLRMTFGVEPAVLEDGLERIKAFCQRNAKEH